MRYALVKNATSIVENIIDWDGDTTKWSPPPDYITITTEDKVDVRWQYDEVTQQWISYDLMGGAQINDTWDGTKFVSPIPEIPQ